MKKVKEWDSDEGYRILSEAYETVTFYTPVLGYELDDLKLDEQKDIVSCTFSINGDKEVARVVLWTDKEGYVDPVDLVGDMMVGVAKYIETRVE